MAAVQTVTNDQAVCPTLEGRANEIGDPPIPVGDLRREQDVPAMERYPKPNYRFPSPRAAHMRPDRERAHTSSARSVARTNASISPGPMGVERQAMPRGAR